MKRVGHTGERLDSKVKNSLKALRFTGELGVQMSWYLYSLVTRESYYRMKRKTTDYYGETTDYYKETTDMQTEMEKGHDQVMTESR